MNDDILLFLKYKLLILSLILHQCVCYLKMHKFGVIGASKPDWIPSADIISRNIEYSGNALS